MPFCTVFIFYYPIWHLGYSKGVPVIADFLPTALPEPIHTPVPAQTPSVTAIPPKLWYKLGPNGLSDQTREWVDSCVGKNPDYRSEFLTDDSGDIYVKENFAFRPDIVETYLALPFPILKADLLRYLLLLAEGRIWNDLDISCEETPIHEWIPTQYKNDANLVVGWEFDVGWGDTFVRQFAS